MAKELNMKSLAFSEHGSTFEWVKKKLEIESAGMKYIHCAELYVSNNVNSEEKKRDNYHICLIAKNYDGVKELNNLITKSFNRKDGHFYYVPRISFEELFETTDNIMMTTACLGGVIGKTNDNELLKRFVSFLIKNKHRCFLEIQHHNCEPQKKYNLKILDIHNKTNIPLIAGTDTHCLNEEHAEARVVFQRAKNVFFENEDDWDLTFKSYNALVDAYQKQNCLPSSIYLEAIENTNLMADMVEEFSLDTEPKYPKLYNNPEEQFKTQIKNSIIEHQYVKTTHNKDEIIKRVNEELDTYIKTKTIDFMLLQKYVRDWEVKNDIHSGFGRGSVSGSLIAYILNITKMDSLKFNLNFFRFLNPSRITCADIDTDYSSKDRDRVKEFLLKDKLNLNNIKTAEIITFNTVALKGAIKEIARALSYSLGLAQELSDSVKLDENGKPFISDEIRKKHQQLFKYVDMINGCIVSIGSHPSGVLVSDRDIEEEIGLCSLKTSDYPVSMLNMKELDYLQMVKLDILGLDNMGLINETCKLANIDYLNPDNTDLEDENVWKSIVEDTTGIFQWESDSASAYLKKFMSEETIQKAKEHNKNFSYIKHFSFGNGLIRPSCKSFREDVANGVILDNGFKELDEFLHFTFGQVVMQEDIMQFLVKFCGYSDAESDTVRRGIAKKYGTEQFIPEIERRFIDYSSTHYNISKEKCREIIKPFLQSVLNASAYGFSWNHSDSYSCIGYICGYLRYYYPLEFMTVGLNIFKDKQEKMNEFLRYMNKAGIKLENIKFGKSGAEYTMDKKNNAIYKGIESIKFLNSKIADELLELSKNNYKDFVSLLRDIKNKTSVNRKQLNILIGLNFFSDYGKNQYLKDVCDIFDKFNSIKQIKKDKLDSLGLTLKTVEKYSSKETPEQFSGIDNQGLVNHLVEKVENKEMPLIEYLKLESEFLGYISYKNAKINNNYYVVASFKTTFSESKPYLILKNLSTGEEVKTRIKDSNIFKLKPFGKFSILDIHNFTIDYKRRKVENEWIVTDEQECILENYEVVLNK